VTDDRVGVGVPHRGLRRLTQVAEALALLGGVLMLAAAVLVCISVLSRWATNDSIPGDFEFVQIAVALAAFSFLPLCQIRRGNIFVETFTASLPRSMNDMLDGVWDLVYAAFAGVIAWRLAVGAAETVANRTTTMVTGLPIGWAIALAAITAAFLAIVAVATALRMLGSRR
jgi:TRAP-type C4-dicarboxylate transport system permease small subunit